MAVEQDPGGSFLPQGEEPIDPAAQLLGIEASLEDPAVFGDVGATAMITVAEEPLPVGRGWAFDFNTGRFISGGGAGAPIQISGTQVLEQRLQKSLLTARGEFEIYSANYGLDGAEEFIGEPILEVLSSDLATRIESALMFDPKVHAVEDVRMQVDPDDEETILAEFTVRTDDDEVIGMTARVV